MPRWQIRVVVAAILALFGPASAEARPQVPDPTVVLPPTPPWSGASERLVAAASDPWITPAERAGFRTTPAYAETRAWLERLAAASPLVTLETFGTSGEGRDLLMVRARKGTAAKPVVLVQAAIHSGEIDGKDAGLMLLRDIALRGKDDLLDRVELVFIPIYNPDGHERASAWNAIALRGPAQRGTRNNARGINLNRDYAKADAPETRAAVALLRRLDPILYVDCHVSEGFDMGYDVTFTYPGWGRYARHAATAGWLQTQFGPAAMAALRRAGHQPIIYPSPIDPREPTRGIRWSPEGPRYSTGYGDFIGVPTVLIETHMLKPFRQRVLGTYVLLEAALRVAGRDAARIAAAKAADRASRPATLLTRWTPAAEPIGWIERFRGVAFDGYRSPATGRVEQRWLGRPVDWRMPIIGQTPAETVRLPRAWWVPPEQAEVIDRLTLHGIRFDRIEAPRDLALDRVTVADARLLAPSDGRVPMEARLIHAPVRETMPAGSLRVPADQPLGLLAAALLEPESQDSFLAWGFFPELLHRPPGAEAFVLAPLADAMLARDAGVRAAFEARVAADPGFAADPVARLDWFVERLPGGERDRAYPIRREP